MFTNICKFCFIFHLHGWVWGGIWCGCKSIKRGRQREFRESLESRPILLNAGPIAFSRLPVPARPTEMGRTLPNMSSGSPSTRTRSRSRLGRSVATVAATTHGQWDPSSSCCQTPQAWPNTTQCVVIFRRSLLMLHHGHIVQCSATRSAADESPERRITLVKERMTMPLPPHFGQIQRFCRQANHPHQE